MGRCDGIAPESSDGRTKHALLAPSCPEVTREADVGKHGQHSAAARSWAAPEAPKGSDGLGSVRYHWQPHSGDLNLLRVCAPVVVLRHKVRLHAPLDVSIAKQNVASA